MSDIEIRNLNYAFGDTLVLKDLNLDYDRSEFLCIVGPNGGGKSTLLKLILGLLKPQSGVIKVQGKAPNKAIKLLGYVPQQIFINKSFPISALEVVLMGLIDKKKFGFYSKSQKNEALKSLEMVGMREFAARRISDLSGGQRQRVYIARALCAKAQILLLDEPTASIDTKGQVQIYNILKDLNQNGTGIVMISHDINLALTYATKAAYIANKELIMHHIDTIKKDEFLNHLKNHHSHFCDIELALKECSCGIC